MTATASSSSSLHFISHFYVHAQELNESASRFVEFGQYERAISTLTTTLELWKNYETADDTAEACMCPRCNPDEKTRFPQTNEKEIDTTMTDVSESVRHQLHQDTMDDDATYYPINFEYGYVYHKLMRIPCRNVFNIRNVGSAVPLIIIFNLAIVHHLSAATSNSRPRMTRALRLYQLANDCLNTYVKDTHGCCCEVGDDEMGELFQMIVLNNLSHLHLFLGHHLRSRKCIEELIPILMCVVDDKVRNIAFRSRGDVSDLCLEGFFRNVSLLVLKSQCAEAA